MPGYGVGILSPKKDVVQVRNPKTDRYVRVDREAGKILGEKKSPGPYANVPVIAVRSEDKPQ
jgi:hypothetical protein